MKVIYKYPVHPTTWLSKGAEILKIAMQGNELCVWAIVDPDFDVEPRIGLFHTGDTLPSSEVKHIGTFLLDDGRYVVHVFDLNASGSDTGKQ
jgi:hypothetical protein